MSSYNKSNLGENGANVENGDDSENINPLLGTMRKLAGIVESKTGLLKVLEPINCLKCYTLSFDSRKNKFATFSSSNELVGCYSISDTMFSFEVTLFGGTKVAEIEDGSFYVAPFWKKTIQSFSLNENELRLYYDNRNYYLLFNIQEL